MKCLYCGGQIVENGEKYVCLDCGRTFKDGDENQENLSVSNIGKKIINPEDGFSLDSRGEKIKNLLKDEEERLRKEEENLKEKEKQKKIVKLVVEENFAKNQVKEKIVSISDKDLKNEFETEDNQEKLSYDLSAYKNINVRDKEMVSEAVHDISNQTKRNALNFSHMFKRYTKAFIENLKKNVKDD